MQSPAPGILRTDKNLAWKDDFVMYYEVEKAGMISLNSLYMEMFHFFVKEGFKSWSGGKELEDFYLQRMRPDGVQENLIWWRAVKNVNPYITYMVKVDWQNFGSKVTEVMYKEKKVKTHKLGIVLRFWWWVQIDPYNKWERGPFPKLTRWFYKYLMNSYLEDHRDKLRTIAKRQENELKQFFEMTTSIPMPRSWFPEMGYKYEKQKPKPEEFMGRPRKPDYPL